VMEAEYPFRVLLGLDNFTAPYLPGQGVVEGLEYSDFNPL